jgi:hypothetical protein
VGEGSIDRGRTGFVGILRYAQDDGLSTRAALAKGGWDETVDLAAGWDGDCTDCAGGSSAMGQVLAAINPATHFTVMQPPGATLCSHPVQRYAATKLPVDELFKISSTLQACGLLLITWFNPEAAFRPGQVYEMPVSHPRGFR